MAFHVDDVVVFKASDYMDYSVHFAYMAEKFVAEALAFRGAFYKPCYVAELDGGVYGFL